MRRKWTYYNPNPFGRSQTSEDEMPWDEMQADEARADGRTDAREGVPFEDNPWDKEPMKSAWEEGWQSMQK